MTRASPRLLELATRRLVARGRARSALSSASAQPIELYRGILRAHRSLPPTMRSLGDEYVKAEFRRHRTAQPEFLDKFLAEWSQYLVQVRGAPQPEEVGEPLSMEQLSSLSDEQRHKVCVSVCACARASEGTTARARARRLSRRGSERVSSARATAGRAPRAGEESRGPPEVTGRGRARRLARS